MNSVLIFGRYDFIIESIEQHCKKYFVSPFQYPFSKLHTIIYKYSYTTFHYNKYIIYCYIYTIIYALRYMYYR